MVVAKRETERARDEERKVRDEQGRTQLAREAAELNLVRSYLRPIGYNTKGVDQAELVALNELAGLEDDRLKLLFLRESLADGDRALRIARRAERVIQAAIGTSLKRRAAAIELMSARQRDKEADPRVRLAACWLAIELGSDDIFSFAEHFNALLNQKNFSDWSNFLDDLPERIHPTQRTRLFASLTSFVGKANILVYPESYDVTQNSLVSLSPRLDTVAAKRGFDDLLTFIVKTTDKQALQAVGKGLEALAPRLDSIAARQGFAQLLSIIGSKSDSYVLQATISGLAALVPRLDAVAAKQGFDELLGIAGKTTDASTLQATMKGLEAFAPRLDAVAAKQGFDGLLSVIDKTTDYNALHAVGKGLAVFAPRLDAVALKQGFDTLLGVIRKTENLRVLCEAEYSLASFAPLVDPPTAKEGFDALLIVIGKSSNFHTLNQLDRYDAAEMIRRAEIAAFAQRLDSGSAKQGFNALLSLISKTSDYDALQALGKGLAALATRLDAVAVKQGFDALVSFIAETTGQYSSFAAGNGLAALAPRLDAVAAKQDFNALLSLIGKTPHQETLLAVGKGLAALAPHVDVVTLNRGIVAWLELIDKTTDNEILRDAGESLAALKPWLDPVAAKRGFDVLAKLLEKNVYISIDNGRSDLIALASRMEAVTAKQVFDSCLSSDKYSSIQQEIIISALIRRLSATLRSSHSAMALTHLLAARPLNSEYVPDYRVVDQLVGMIDSAEDLTNLLRDPACQGSLKDSVLLRLEELAYPNPTQAAAFVGMGANANSAIIITAVKAASDEKRKFDRRFRTVSDAAQWLAEHHPEIDLDRPYRQNETGK